MDLSLTVHDPIAHNVISDMIEEAPIFYEKSRIAVKVPFHNVETERIILSLEKLFNVLQKLPTLEPVSPTRKLLNQIYDLVALSKTTAEEDQRILGDSRIAPVLPKIWELWGTCEYLLERDFAKKVIAGSSPACCYSMFRSFPYMDQYDQLSRLETNAINTALGEIDMPSSIKKMGILGSGPTPFTSLNFYHRYGTSVQLVNVDRNAEAIEYGRAVVRSCGIKTISFVLSDVKDLTDLTDFDIVHFAAMIGENEVQKKQLLLQVASVMRPGALIYMRSTESLRSCLYPRIEITASDVLAKLTPILTTRYYAFSTSLTGHILRVD